MKMKLPSFSCYGPYGGNYGAHALKFTDAEGNEFWYSYQTLVAFSRRGHNTVVHQNDWGTTTGKHLNAIDGGNKKARVNSENFNRIFQEQFGAALAEAA